MRNPYRTQEREAVTKTIFIVYCIGFITGGYAMWYYKKLNQ